MKDPANDQTSNPFATRWTRPGAIPFQFPEGTSLEDCLARLRGGAERRLQILGPHGCGKSTLLRTLLDSYRERGGRAELRRVGPRGAIEEVIEYDDFPDEDNLPRTPIWLCVDGWEQLPWLHRLSLRATKTHLLVTTHRDLGWPTLLQPQPTIELAIQLARQLQQQLPHHRRLDNQVVSQCFQRCGGNMRETLFALYDEHEQARRRFESPNED